MRIGFDLSPLCGPPSGIGTYATNLFRNLQMANSDEIIPLSHQPTDREGSPRLNKTLWMQTVLPLSLNQHRLDLAHFTNNVCPIWSPCPTVLTLHDMTLWLFPRYHTWRRLISMRPLIPLAVHQASQIITVSESSKADIVRILRVQPEKVQVIYEAPAPCFQPLNLAMDAAIQHLLPEKFILYVGTIEPRKNLVRLVEAFAKISAQGLSHHLVFVGHRGWKEGPLYTTIEKLSLSDKVHFLGEVSEQALVEIYNLADVLAFPSLYEGFGLPVAEAMACGTPVLTSARGSLREVTGDAALLVDPLSVDSIADGLAAILAEPSFREELRGRGLAQVNRFSWQTAAAQTRQVYLQALANPTEHHAPTPQNAL